MRVLNEIVSLTWYFGLLFDYMKKTTMMDLVECVSEEGQECGFGDTWECVVLCELSVVRIE